MADHSYSGVMNGNHSILEKQIRYTKQFTVHRASIKFSYTAIKAMMLKQLTTVINYIALYSSTHVVQSITVCCLLPLAAPLRSPS